MTKRATFVLFGLTATVLASNALAAGHGSGMEITPFGGYRFGGTFNAESSSGAYELDDASAYGLIVNFPHRDNTQWELLYSRQSANASFDTATINDPAVDIELHVLQVGGTYQGTGNKVRPYLAATIGGTHIKVNSRGSESDTFFSGSIGVGLQLLPESRFGLRLEARAYGTLTNSNTDLFCRTGPDLNVCALRVEGDMLSQVETFAGFVFRF